MNGRPVVLRAWTTEKLCPPFHQETLPALPPALSGLSPWADDFDGGLRHISLLIGADQLWSVCTGELIREPGFPVAVGSVFGWMFSGQLPESRSSTSISDCCSLILFIQERDPEFLWSLETIGIEDPVDNVDRELPVFVSDRYQLPLPFKDYRRPQCNLDAAKAQLHRLEQSLTDDKHELYAKKIKALIHEGIVEKATTPPNVGFYMPYHGVWKRKPRHYRL